MTKEEIIADEKYHTCGRCKWDGLSDNSYPCNSCIHSMDKREDLWEYVESEDKGMKVNVSMDLTVSQAFHILLKTLNVEMYDNPKFEVNKDGEIVCDYDDRGELYLALYHLATKIFPNTEFRHLFDNPNTLIKDLYIAKESVDNE